MRTLIAISRCLKTRTESGEFSFKGFYAGEEIKKLELQLDPGQIPWKKGEDYILYIRVLSIKAGVLTGSVTRSRLLDELVCRD